MNIANNIPLTMFIITTLLLYIVGLIAFILSILKYKYSKLWLILGLLLFICPPLILILISYCEKNEIRKNLSTATFLKAKIIHNISIAIFIFYYSLYPLFLFFFKYISVNKDWYKETAIVALNIVMLALVPLFLYIKKKINTLGVKEQE